MKRILPILLMLFCWPATSQIYAQCNIGEVAVTIDVATDNWGFELYWELVPVGNACGTGTIFSGGNSTQVGCNGAGQQTATAGGYANNATVTEGPFCLLAGSSFDIKSIDDYGDGGTVYTVNMDGFPVHVFTATGGSSTFSFTATSPPPYNAGMESIETFSYVNTSPVEISGVLGNYGTTTITTLDLSYSVNGGAAVTQSLSGLSIAPFTTYDFVHATDWTPASTGMKNLRIWTSNVNGNPDQDVSNDTLLKVVEVGDPIPNIIDAYLTTVPVLDVVSNSSNQVSTPQDLDFHPTLSRKELWVVNRNTENSGGSTVKISNAGEANQTELWQRDGNAWHFMSLPTGIAFGENENFATSPGVFDANHNGGAPFTGPSLWSSDPAIYAQPSGGNGSHLDMLHASPYAMGIAHETGNAYWLFDANNNDIVYYDFVEDHGPGNADHSDGVIRRVTSFAVDRINPDITCHLVLDKATDWLYIVDGSGPRILRMDITSGTIGGNPTYAQSEPLAEYSNISNVTWEELVTTGLTEPAGIAIIEDRLLVSDHANGDIVVYDISGTGAVEMGRIMTGSAGIMGITIGPEGHIWFVNATTDEVVKIDQGPVSVDPAVRDEVRIFPNPASDRLYLDWGDKDMQGGKVVVRNMMGQEMLRKEIASFGRESLDISRLPAGTYTVGLEKGGTSVAVERLVKL